MSGILEGREQAEVGESDPAPAPIPAFALDGRDILARACMAALVEGQRNLGGDSDFDFSTAIFKALKEATDHNIGPHEPSSWLCINVDDFRIGRAYPFKGEHRIVAVTPDAGLLDDIEGNIISEEA